MLKWQIVDLVSAVDSRGLLTAFDIDVHVPFAIRRIFYIQRVPPGCTRGHHADDSYEFLVCAKGSVDIRLDDGRQRAELRLDDPAKGLLLMPMVWVELSDFSDDALLLALASKPYDPTAIVRDYDRFLAITSGMR